MDDRQARASTPFIEDRIRKILSEHKDKNFVDRILNPGRYPKIKNPNGKFSTHRMSWGDDGNGKYIVYPQIIDHNGQLTLLSQDEAQAYAWRTGEYIPFDSPQEADGFSRDYKKIWKEP
jgi:CRISPR/Cas system Type II protein with McrA/HNH and RuvC-like nuclease domain